MHGCRIAWWHANNFPQHRFADVFGDVIGNVRASGGIGEMADDCVRGAVDVLLFIFRRFGVCNIYNKLYILEMTKVVLIFKTLAWMPLQCHPHQNASRPICMFVSMHTSTH